MCDEIINALIVIKEKDNLSPKQKPVGKNQRIDVKSKVHGGGNTSSPTVLFCEFKEVNQ